MRDTSISCTPPTRDRALNPGTCPDQGLNQQPFGSQAGAQSAEPHQPGRSRTFSRSHVHVLVIEFLCLFSAASPLEGLVFSILSKLLQYRFGVESLMRIQRLPSTLKQCVVTVRRKEKQEPGIPSFSFCPACLLLSEVKVIREGTWSSCAKK